MSNLSKRLDIHFAAVAAAAGAGLMANVGVAEAAIVHVPGANIPINADFYGVYLNFATGATGGTSAGTPGWDINPYLGPAIFHPGSPIAGGVVGTTTTSGPLNLAPGTPIGAGSTYDTGVATAVGAALGDPVIFGFRFHNEGAAQTQYAWARMRLPATGVPGIIYEYAYENSGASINAGAIPAPGTFGLLALGAAGLAGRRRK